MGAYSCPNCKAVVNAPSPDGLVCGRCGFGSAAGPTPMNPTTQGIPTAGVMHGNGPMCPRCRSTHTQRGGIPTWAVVCAIVGFFIVCVLSLLFLIAKDDNQCFNCGMRWKQ